MDEQRFHNQLELTYNSSVKIQDIAWKTSRWTIEMGGERGSGRSVLAAQNDNDDDDYDNFTYIWNPDRYYLLGLS